MLISGLFLATSCEKDEIGGTATEKMAGEWYVTCVAIDASGNLMYTDDELFGLGQFHLDTYNTAADDVDSMWIDDNKNMYLNSTYDYSIKTKIAIDLNSETFSIADATNGYNSTKIITITDGKILKGAATTPSGMPADSIVFTVSFSGDPLPSIYGYTAYRVAGYRYTGFTNDN